MNNGRNGRQTGAFHSMACAGAAMLVVAASLVMTVVGTARAADETALDAQDAKCQRCHSRNRQKTLEDGDQLSLQVDKVEFLDSVHGMNGCSSCHAEIAGKKHPSKRSISSKQAFKLEQNQNCRECHDEKFAQYEGSIHASLVTAGNITAPVCTDCHSAHAVQAIASPPSASDMTCNQCHEDVYDAYALSVHGKARTEGNVVRDSGIQAPICSDCHQAHEVEAVAAGDRLKSACLDCHEGVEALHAKWLPNAGLHMNVVSCAACHAPLAERGIDLELYHRQTTEPVALRPSTPAWPGTSENAAGEAVEAGDLDQLVRESNKQARTSDVAVRGRIKVRNGADAHQLAIKSEAVRRCETCHEVGSEAFQNVTVSVSRPDGRKQYYDVDSEILTSVKSVYSLGDFYAIGGTRIQLFDALLLLGLLAGLAIPAGHASMGWLLRKREGTDEQHDQSAGQPAPASHARVGELYINPLPVRIWHWINALGFIGLVLTGVQLRYLDVLGLMSFEAAVKLHNWVGFAVMANYFVWLGFYLLSDKISNYQPVLDPQTFVRNFYFQLRYYCYGIFKREPSPHHVQPYDKFNPMQKMTYQMVMLVAVPVQFVTGLMMWNISGFSGWIDMVGGIRVVATVHVLLFIFFVSFILVHAYMGALGRKPSTHFKEMITGYEEPED